MRKFLAFLLLALPGATPAAEPGSLIARIKSVGREGAGNTEAQKAWRELVQLGPGVLPEVLTALNDADATSANWLRSAVEVVADQAAAARKPLPIAALEAFVKETKNAGAARRLAYELLVRADPAASARLIPDMLNDPGQEMRRDAVALVLREGQGQLDQGNKDAAAATLKKALSAARDGDQVDQIAKLLAKLGGEVDLQAHFGFVRHWHLVTGFDNGAAKGFNVVYPPEKGVDLGAAYQVKGGEQAKWQPYSVEPLAGPAELIKIGLVDINKAIGKQKGVVAYAFAAVQAAKEMPVELRASTPNAIQIFLNGKQVFFRDEYHHGNRFDQHVGRSQLRQGRNEILVKVLQNEQTEDWAQVWAFQLRLCDAIGGALPVTVEKK